MGGVATPRGAVVELQNEWLIRVPRQRYYDIKSSILERFVGSKTCHALLIFLRVTPTGGRDNSKETSHGDVPLTKLERCAGDRWEWVGWWERVVRNQRQPACTIDRTTEWGACDPPCCQRCRTRDKPRTATCSVFDSYNH